MRQLRLPHFLVRRFVDSDRRRASLVSNPSLQPRRPPRGTTTSAPDSRASANPRHSLTGKSPPSRTRTTSSS
jgi:hypothetical protein